MLDGLTKFFYDAEKFKSYSSCAICLMDFSAESQVTPLPCNVKHYFCTECITNWLKTNQCCPICRHPVTEAELAKFQT